MVSFSSLLLVCIATAAVWAAPTKDNEKRELVARQSYNVGSTGTNNGYYYTFFTEGVGAVLYTNGAGGQYKVTWSNAGYFYAGKGWNPGSANDITYSGTYSPTDNSFLAVYGWTTSPLTEYYIVESYGTVDPSSLASQKGSVTTDGGTYTILETTRTNEPSIEGTATYQQYWSVRTSHRVSGTITTSNHFNAWAALGMPLGSFNWQLLSIHAYNSSGSASITIESAASTSATCSVKYGQCGGSQWTGATCCQSGSTCTYSSAYYSQCI